MIKRAEATTGHYKKLTEILGKQHVQNKVESPYDFIHIATKGVNAVVIKNFRNYFNISREEIANMLNISSPTLYRWIKANKNLERNYSVQLFELADLFLYGSELFHSKGKLQQMAALTQYCFRRPGATGADRNSGRYLQSEGCARPH